MALNVMRKMQSFPKILPLKIADCNFGLGGHSKLLLKHFTKANMYINIDTDRPLISTHQSSATSNSIMQMTYLRKK